ncbi:MAG: hypothetical protein RL272_742 [Candidatus Parcubacteria bacterium]|jgi:putative sigma-54 modulation protein
MQFSIKAKGITLTEAIKTAVEKKLASLDKKAARFGASVTGEVEVGKTTRHHKKGLCFRAEIHVRLPGKLVYAEALHEDLYAAIGDAKREAERQVSTFKGSLAAKQKRGARAAKRGARGDKDRKGGRVLNE